jgi:hypothetical protein
LIDLPAGQPGCRPGLSLTRGRHPGEAWFLHGRAVAERQVR